jgi:exonuclease III
MVSPALAGLISNADILDDIMGSDHCPVLLDMDFPNIS